jgi:hypothetical protein
LGGLLATARAMLFSTHKNDQALRDLAKPRKSAAPELVQIAQKEREEVGV